MRAIERVMARLDRYSQRVALVCCLLVDRFKASRSPADLQEAQDFIRLGLRHTRALVREQRSRSKRRGLHYSARKSRKPELGPLIGKQIERLKGVEQLLDRRRYILKASADALAWIALAAAPSAIPRLFRPQTHDDVIDERGLVGHIAVQQAAHESGRFLVLENDLTRCLGLGDLTVLSLADPTLPPLSVEVKTQAPEIEEGAEVSLQLSLVELDHPRAKEVLEDFSTLMGTEEREPERPAAADTRQMANFFEQSAAVIRAHGREAAKLGVVAGNWKTVMHVLGRAVPGRPALDIAEPGVWVAGIAQKSDGSLLEHDLEELANLAMRLIPVAGGHEIGFAHTLQLEQHAVTGALGLPVGVWSLPPLVRAKILNADLVLASFVDLSVLVDALRAQGIVLRMEEKEWIVQKGDVEFVFPGAAVARARIDVAFGALNLRSLADRINDMMSTVA